MDISSISSYTDYLKTTASNSSVDTTSLKSKDYSNATDDELMEVCKEFESYFLEQIYKEMWKTVETDDSSSSSISTLKDYYQDEMIKELSSQATEQNSTGLAQMLYEQMKRNVQTTIETGADTVQAGTQANEGTATQATE